MKPCHFFYLCWIELVPALFSTFAFSTPCRCTCAPMFITHILEGPITGFNTRSPPFFNMNQAITPCSFSLWQIWFISVIWTVSFTWRYFRSVFSGIFFRMIAILVCSAFFTFVCLLKEEKRERKSIIIFCQIQVLIVLSYPNSDKRQIDIEHDLSIASIVSVTVLWGLGLRGWLGFQKMPLSKGYKTEKLL